MSAPSPSRPTASACSPAPDDKTVRLWDAATGAAIADARGPHGSRSTPSPSRPTASTCLAGSDDKTVRLWDAATGAAVATLEGHKRLASRAVAFSPDGKRRRHRLPTTRRSGCGTWRPAPWSRRSKATRDPISAVAFSPDGTRVLTGFRDGTVRLWDAATGGTAATLEGHAALSGRSPSRPTASAFSPAPTTMTARLWDAATGAAVATLEGHKGFVVAVAFSPDGKRVLTGSEDNTARQWEIFPSAQALVEKVEASIPRCLTPDERKQFHLLAPRWCYARNLWPYLDHGPPETPGSNPPYGPPPMTWDEKLVSFWDRWTGWLAGSDGQARNETKSP